MVIITLAPGFYQALGIIGFGFYVIGYLMLTLRFLRSESIAFFALNAAAAGLVLISLTAAFNLASALIQAFWIAISLLGIAIRLAVPHPSGSGERSG